MKDFYKSVALMFIAALIGSFSTVTSISSDIAILSNKVDTTVNAIDKIVIKLDKFDERIRKNEIYQAQFKREYLAAN
jgi:hypothetical protein